MNEHAAVLAPIQGVRELALQSATEKCHLLARMNQILVIGRMPKWHDSAGPHSLGHRTMPTTARLA
jgi:hypothetical protein